MQSTQHINFYLHNISLNSCINPTTNQPNYLEAPNSTLIVSKRFSAKSFALSRLFGLLLDKNKCNGCCPSAIRER